MQQENIQLQKAFLKIQAAKAIYYHQLEKAEVAWRFQSYYVDFDPRTVDPSATNEEIENHHALCNEFLAMASLRDIEKDTAYRNLQTAYKKYYELEESLA